MVYTHMLLFTVEGTIYKCDFQRQGPSKKSQLWCGHSNCTTVRRQLSSMRLVHTE